MVNDKTTFLCLLGAFVLVLGPTAFGTTHSGTIDVKARVLAPITASHGADLDFGDVLQDSSLPIATTSGDAGRFDISGVTTGGTSVELTFDAPADLGGAGLTFAGNYAWGTTQGTPKGTTTNATATFASPPASFSVWIGGTLTVGPSVPAASYSEQFTLTVDYVN